MTDATLDSILNIHIYLKKLDINGCDSLSNQSLEVLTRLKELTFLDISWIRNVNDELLKKLLEGMVDLESCLIYGCHELSSFCLDRVWKNKGDGRVIKILGNEFS